MLHSHFVGMNDWYGALTRFHPNVITVMGLVINAIRGVLIALGALIAGGVVLLLASIFDVLDGAVARVTGKVYRYGASSTPPPTATPR